MFDFGDRVNWDSFQNQVLNLMKDREALMQIGFDFYDSGNDNLISELDVYKVFQFFCKSPTDK